MFADALTAALIAIAVLALLLVAAGAVLLPVRARGVHAELVVEISGGADCPERTIAGACFIAKLAGIRARVDCRHADEATAAAVKKLLRGRESEMYMYEGDTDGQIECRTCE